MAIEHVDDASSVGSESRVVSDHNNSIAGGVDIAELFHNDVGGARVEIAGRLVGEDDFGVGDEGTGDGNTLLLTAGELPGHVVFAFFKMETIEGFGGEAETMRFRITSVDEGKGNVFYNGEGRNEVKILEDEADLARAEVSLAAARDTLDVFTV